MQQFTTNKFEKYIIVGNNLLAEAYKTCATEISMY